MRRRGTQEAADLGRAAQWQYQVWNPDVTTSHR